MHNVHSLPLELLCSVASHLGFRDLCAWALSSRRLYAQLLGSDEYCGKLLQVRFRSG